MKFRYTKVLNNNQEYSAAFDTEIVWGWLHVPEAEGQAEVLMLHTTLPPVEKYEKYPLFNKKGEVTGYIDRKITEIHTITLTKKEDIDAYFALSI